MGNWKYAVLSHDAAGVTRFTDVEVEFESIPFAPPAPSFGLAAPMPSGQVVMGTFPKGWTSEGHWHTTPTLQFIVILTGGLEITVGSGETRAFGPGTALLLDDVHTGGHLTRNTAESETNVMFVQLEGKQ